MAPASIASANCFWFSMYILYTVGSPFLLARIIHASKLFRLNKFFNSAFKTPLATYLSLIVIELSIFFVTSKQLIITFLF